MALNLDDNKRPYFKQLNLDDTFDEIQNAVNALETQVPNSGSSITVNSVTLASQPATVTSTATTVNVLTVDSNGQIGKKAKSNVKVIRGKITQTSTNPPSLTILQNDTNITFSPVYNDVGDYYIGFSQNIDASKSFWSLTPYQTSANFGFAVADDGMQILVAYQDGLGDTVPQDGKMFNVPFEILLYNQ